MKRRYLVAGLAGAVVLAGGLVWLGVSGSTTEPDLVDLVPALAEPASPGTPPSFDMSAGDDSSIDRSTWRMLAEDDRAEYWVARTQGDRLCLFAVMVEAEMTGSSCTTSHDFQANGVWVGVAPRPGGGVRAYLAPAGYIPQDLPRGLERLAPSFVAGDPGDTTRTAVVFQGAAGMNPERFLFPL